MNAIIKELFPNQPKYLHTDRVRPGVHPVLKALSSEEIALTGAAPGQKRTLVSSYKGEIKRLLMTFPSYVSRDGQDSVALRSLIEALPKTTKFIIVHHESRLEPYRTWFLVAGHDEANIDFVPVNNSENFRDWAEDPYVSALVIDDDSQLLVEPYFFSDEGDQYIAGNVASAPTDVSAAQVPLCFQGGNCLIGDDFWFMGWDFVADSIELAKDPHGPFKLCEDDDAYAFVLQKFKELVEGERKLITLGTQSGIYREGTYGAYSDGRWFLDFPNEGIGKFQPIFHIDMFVTLLGRDGDGRFRVLVGCLRLGENLTGARAPYALAAAYDEIADQLRREEFSVIRCPLVHRWFEGEENTLACLERKLGHEDGDTLRNGLDELRALGAKPTDVITSRKWYHMTWNNCLVERIGNGGTIYMPTFGHGENDDLAPIDDYMEDLFKAEGFAVQRLADFSVYAKRSGVVHCITKYLQRG